MDTTHAQQLARALMDAYGLQALPFGWNHARRQFGRCLHQRDPWTRRSSAKRIELSRPLVLANPVEVVRETILHEIAHALAGHEAGHGPAWRAKALEVGAKPERCMDTTSPDSKAVTLQGRFTYSCPACGWAMNRMRRLRRGGSCPKCSGGRYNPQYSLQLRAR